MELGIQSFWGEIFKMNYKVDQLGLIAGVFTNDYKQLFC